MRRRRCLEAIANHNFEYDHEPVAVTISLGLAEVVPGDDADMVIRRADEALYLSKAAGRNCGHFHSGTDFLALDSPRLLEHVSEASAAAAVSAAAGAGLHETEEEDRMTGLPQAAAFAHELRRRVQRCRSENTALAMVLVDVDGLTQINAAGGRSAGDLLLRHTADLLRSHCRREDFLARYHQGQFALLLDGATIEEAVDTAEQVRLAARDFGREGGRHLSEATLSCGVAAVQSGDRSVSVVMRAGIALAAAKSSGRDCTFVHDGQSAEPADGTYSP
ncbi:MAG: diguanylate cyclase [Pirellulales bacterium]